MSKIYIEKLAEVPGGLPAIKQEDYKLGKLNFGGSIPVEYNVEGILHSVFEVGKSLVVLRQKRNNIPVDGVFMTSPITEIGEKYFKTLNSVYSYKFL